MIGLLAVSRTLPGMTRRDNPARRMPIQFANEMQARAMLNPIKLTFPDDPVIPQADVYLAFLDKLAATPAKPSP